MTQVRKILIADDDEELRGELVEQLALHAEFEPVHAATAAAALVVAREASPDLVIMDVGLPDMDGTLRSPLPWLCLKDRGVT